MWCRKCNIFHMGIWEHVLTYVPLLSKWHVRNIHKGEDSVVCGRRFFPRTAVVAQRVSVERPSVWPCVTRCVKLPVKPTETGTGHRQQHRWRVSLCFSLSVFMQGGEMSVFLETSRYETTRIPAHMAGEHERPTRLSLQYIHARRPSSNAESYIWCWF